MYENAGKIFESAAEHLQDRPTIPRALEWRQRFPETTGDILSAFDWAVTRINDLEYKQIPYYMHNVLVLKRALGERQLPTINALLQQPEKSVCDTFAAAMRNVDQLLLAGETSDSSDPYANFHVKNERQLPIDTITGSIFYGYQAFVREYYDEEIQVTGEQFHNALLESIGQAYDDYLHYGLSNKGSLDWVQNAPGLADETKYIYGF